MYKAPDMKNANEMASQPPMIEQLKDGEGRTYFMDHSTKTTSWTDPRVPMAPVGQPMQQMVPQNPMAPQSESLLIGDVNNPNN